MARRKNSAEMLDVLRRISTEDKARRVRQIKKEELEQASAAPRAPGAVPSGMGPSAMEPPGQGSANRLDLVPHPQGEALFGGSRLRRLEPLPLPEDEKEATGRWRRSLLSVLSAVRSARVGGDDGAAAPDRLPKGNGEGRDALALAPPEVISLESRHMLTPAAHAGGLHAAGAPKGANGPEAADWPPGGAWSGSHSRQAGDERDSGGPGEHSAAGPATAPLPPLEPFQPSPGAGSSGVGEIIRRPLFGFSRDEGGLRGILARAAQKLVGEAISGGLRQRVEIRLVTLGLYAAVAVLAMLVVALILNSPGRDRNRENQLIDDMETSAPGPPLPLEIVPPGRSALPDVKNIVIEPAAQAKGANGKSEQGGGPREGAAAPPETRSPAGELAQEKVWTGQRGPPGWYVQVQGTVSPEHAELIIEHLKNLGFRSIWKRPQVQVQGSPTVETYLIRLCPYPTKEAAEAEKAKFQQLIKQNPLKRPKLRFWDPYVAKYP